MDVLHQPGACRFVIACDGGPAVLEYALLPAGGVDFHHTWVPPQHRGSPMASRLVTAGLAWARAQGLPIQASCWYVRKVLERQAGGCRPPAE